MVEYGSKITVPFPPETVFRYLVEPELQALWSDVPMRRLTEGPIRTGSRMELTFGKGPIKAVLGLELTAVDPGHRMAFETFSGPIRWDGAYTLRPTAGGTELSQQGRLIFTGLWRLLSPIVGAEIKSGEIKELERLKSVIEGRESG